MEDKDFYFSQKHKEYRLKIDSEPFALHEFMYRPVYFKGIEYTECITKGDTPMSNHFGDLIFLGTGTYDDIRHKTVKAYDLNGNEIEVVLK